MHEALLEFLPKLLINPPVWPACPQIRSMPLEVGLCLELRQLNLLSNPLDGPFPSGSSEAATASPSDVGVDGAAGPSTWHEAYVGPRVAMCQVQIFYCREIEDPSLDEELLRSNRGHPLCRTRLSGRQRCDWGPNPCFLP